MCMTVQQRILFQIMAKCRGALPPYVLNSGGKCPPAPLLLTPVTYCNENLDIDSMVLVSYTSESDRCACMHGIHDNMG